jgi:hypothetical protein
LNTDICIEIFFQDDGIPSHLELEQCEDEDDDDDEYEDEDDDDDEYEDE